MSRLDERRLWEALQAAVPTPPAAADRPERARRLAGRIRWQRRLGVLTAVVAVVVAIGLPVGLTRLPGPAPATGPRSVPPAAPGPVEGPSPGAAVSIPSCPGRVCHPGRVIAAIERPLHLPSTGPGGRCPTSPVRELPAGAGYAGQVRAVGTGPVYLAHPTGRNAGVPIRPTTGGWLGEKVIWVVSRHYGGPLLLRGARVDGSGTLRFAHYLGAAGRPGYGPGSHGFPSLLYVRDGLHSAAPHVTESIPSDIYVRRPGCYAIQVDGEGFSEVLVFRGIR